MPALQVRDFPDDLYEELRVSAQNDHRSIAQQTIYVVEQYLRMKHDHIERKASAEREKEERIAKRKELFKRISERPPHVVPDDFPSAAEIVREGRDSR